MTGSCELSVSCMGKPELVTYKHTCKTIERAVRAACLPQLLTLNETGCAKVLSTSYQEVKHKSLVIVESKK